MWFWTSPFVSYWQISQTSRYNYQRAWSWRTWRIVLYTPFLLRSLHWKTNQKGYVQCNTNRQKTGKPRWRAIKMLMQEVTQILSSIGRMGSSSRMITRNTASSSWTCSTSFSPRGTATIVTWILQIIALSLRMGTISRYTVHCIGLVQRSKSLRKEKQIRWFCRTSSIQLERYRLRK